VGCAVGCNASTRSGRSETFNNRRPPKNCEHLELAQKKPDRDDYGLELNLDIY